jgi:hypothetical protein
MSLNNNNNNNSQRFCSGDKIKAGVMSGTCITHREKREMHTKVCLGILKDATWDRIPGENGNVILKCIFRKWVCGVDFIRPPRVSVQCSVVVDRGSGREVHDLDQLNYHGRLKDLSLWTA